MTNTKLEKKTTSEEMRDFLTPSKEIRICHDKQGYWVFDNEWINKTHLTENSPTSEWTKGIKPLKSGENTFEGDFANGHYLIKIKIDSKELMVSIYRDDWEGIINKETFKLTKTEPSEKRTLITPQIFAYLEDFGLIKSREY